MASDPSFSLETEHLVLEPHTAADLADCAALWGDPMVTRFIGGRPLTTEETWARILRYAGLWTLLGFGYWAVRDKATGRFVGDVGFADFRRSIEPPLGNRPEIGWVLAPWAQGRGFGLEVVTAALAWVDRRFDQPETVCIIAPEHERSIRLAERVGFRRQTTGLYNGTPMVVFSRMRGGRTET